MECARAAVGRGARPLHWHQLLRDIRAAVGLLQRREAGPRHAAEVRHAITSANILVDEDGFPGRSGQPTRHNILRHLAWLVLGAKPGDVLFLFFSGHGTQTKALHDAAEEFDQCLLPVDYEKKRLHPGQRHPQGASVAPARGGAADRGVRLLPLGHDDGPGLQVRLQCLLRSAVRGPHGAHPRGERREGGCADGVRLRRRPDVRRRARHGNSGHGIHGAGGAITQCLTYMIQNRTTASYRDLFHATRDMLHRKGYTQIPQLCASKPLDLQQQFSLMNKFVTDKSVA
ncbi:Caspase domain [Trypanosoma vivax]|nr:Caspase domain [Trypanosoma vivax]